MQKLRLFLGTLPLSFGLVAGAASAQSESDKSWQGGYAGFHLGGIYADFENRLPTLPGPTGDNNSGIGGIQLGYNWQRGGVVLGTEIDFSLMDVSGSLSGGNFSEESMGSLRFRAGMVQGDILYFGSLGIAWTETKTALSGVGSASDFEPGLMLGGGAEKWISDSISGRVEAYFVDVPKSNQTVGGTTTSAGSQNLILRAGLNLHF